MLINAKYLNSDQLASYVAALEDGVRESRASRVSVDKSRSGGIDAKFVKGDLGRNTVDDETITTTDHDYARLKRLLDAAASNPENAGWVEVLQPEIDLAESRIGNLVQWECDVYIPETIKALQQNGGIGEAIKMMQNLEPAAKSLGLDMSGLPSSDELEAISRFTDTMQIAPILIGDDDDTDWKVAGSIDPKWIRNIDEIEGRCIVIGKVRKLIPAGRWHLMASLPGMNLLSREERRKKERSGPTDAGEESQYIAGPVAILDFLAVYS